MNNHPDKCPTLQLYFPNTIKKISVINQDKYFQRYKEFKLSTRLNYNWTHTTHLHTHPQDIYLIQIIQTLYKIQ